MKKILRRTLGTAAIAALAVGGVAAPASAAVAPATAASSSAGDVQVVDKPDTGDLHNDWTFAPLGVPVLGLIQSVAEVPGKVVPSGS